MLFLFHDIDIEYSKKEEETMKTSQLVIDAQKSVGRKLALTDITPVYRYDNGQRTDNLDGYRYTVCIESKEFCLKDFWTMLQRFRRTAN